MTNNFEIKADNISKYFGRNLVFTNINLCIKEPSVCVVTGKNGSGKSTLLKIISGLVTPTKGDITFSLNEEKIKKEYHYRHLGYISPYLVFYDEFSLLENLLFSVRVRGLKPDTNKIYGLIEEVGLNKRENDPLKSFSSGMKQRVKYIFSVLHDPSILLIDEPTSNLDEEGKKYVYEFINRYKKEKIIIIATNEKYELNLSENILNLDLFKINDKNL